MTLTYVVEPMTLTLYHDLSIIDDKLNTKIGFNQIKTTCLMDRCFIFCCQGDTCKFLIDKIDLKLMEFFLADCGPKDSISLLKDFCFGHKDGI